MELVQKAILFYLLWGSRKGIWYLDVPLRIQGLRKECITFVRNYCGTLNPKP